MQAIKEQRETCKLILAYTWGTPVAQGQDDIENRIANLEKAANERPPYRQPHRAQSSAPILRLVGFPFFIVPFRIVIAVPRISGDVRRSQASLTCVAAQSW